MMAALRGNRTFQVILILLIGLIFVGLLFYIFYYRYVIEDTLKTKPLHFAVTTNSPFGDERMKLTGVLDTIEIKNGEYIAVLLIPNWLPSRIYVSLGNASDFVTEYTHKEIPLGTNSTAKRSEEQMKRFAVSDLYEQYKNHFGQKVSVEITSNADALKIIPATCDDACVSRVEKLKAGAIKNQAIFREYRLGLYLRRQVLVNFVSIELL